MSAWTTGEVEVRAQGSDFPVIYAERPTHGTPLVYLHGLGSSRRDFEPAALAPELSTQRLIAVDLPGSGASRIPRDLGLSIEDLVGVIESVLEAIDTKRFHLVGHSMGGLVALLVASRNPQSVATLVNVEGNLAPVDCRVFSRRVAELAATHEPEDLVELLASALAKSPRPGYATFAERFRSEVQPEAFVRYCRSIVEVTEREPLLETFQGLGIPRLILNSCKCEVWQTNDLRAHWPRVAPGSADWHNVPHVTCSTAGGSAIPQA